MPKIHTFPTLFDDVHKLNISSITIQGWHKPNQVSRGSISWSRNNQETASISVNVNTMGNPYVELVYSYKDEPRQYRINIVSVPSNLGNGEVWYFVCPTTFKRCRVLYLVGGYFLHRTAFNNCMYESQTYSKKTRTLIQMFSEAMVKDEVYSQLYSKYFKSHYRGKPTKRYSRLKRKLEISERYSPLDIQRMFLC